jgi:uncharacterized protein (DUF2384 family)
MITEPELKDRLRQLVYEKFIETWLDQPNEAFGFKTPRQLVIEQNTKEIEAMLYRLESGIST